MWAANVIVEDLAEISGLKRVGDQVREEVAGRRRNLGHLKPAELPG